MEQDNSHLSRVDDLNDTNDKLRGNRGTEFSNLHQIVEKPIYYKPKKKNVSKKRQKHYKEDEETKSVEPVNSVSSSSNSIEVSHLTTGRNNRNINLTNDSSPQVSSIQTTKQFRYELNSLVILLL